MRNLTIRVLIALVTFTSGTIAASVWLFYPSRKSETPAAQNIRLGPRNESDEISRSLPNPATPEALTGVREEFGIIGDTIGLIVLNERNYGKGDFIHFFNEDGSLWHKFTYYYDDSDGEFEYANDDFRPFAFHVDYHLLALRCVGKDNGHYEVIVNEETGLRKYVKVHDPALKLEAWKEHILNVFAVDFNQEQNPLLDAPQGRVKKVALPDTPFHPVKVKGEWLKVRWDTLTGSAVSEYDSGWIRWRKGKRLLVELSYLC